MLEQKNFYLQNNKTIVYVLQIDGQNPYGIGHILRFEKENENERECKTISVQLSEHLKHLNLSKEKLEAKIIIEDDIKKVYFPSLARSLNYIEMIQEYIWEGDIWTQAQPFGYTYNMNLCPKDNLMSSSWDVMYDIINWVHKNFNRIDYEILKLYGNTDDIYEEEAVQVGFGIWFNDINHFNLMRLAWGNKIYDLEFKNERYTK